MLDRPIIFSAPMVLGLLREVEEVGTGKSQTRRLAWRERKEPAAKKIYRSSIEHVASPWQRVKPSDRLWVKEGWRWNVDHEGHVCFRADYPAREALPVPDANYRWRSPLHLSRRLSRLTLVVTGVKIERVQAISEQDCERESVRWDGEAELWHVTLPSGQIVPGDTARNCFRMLWVALNGREAWASNPEVVAITFTVHAENIDEMKEAA